MSGDFNIVGRSVVRQDAYAKVTGQAKFADDYKFPGMLFGVMVRTDVSHALIHSIDYSGLLDYPEVTVCDINDIRGSRKVGVVTADQPVFCYEKIVTPGDVICMLVGADESQLKLLTAKVKTELEELPLITDPEKALDPDATFIHPDKKSNLIVHYPLRKGDVEKGFHESKHVIEQKYTTPLIEHAYLEPEAVTAVPIEGRGGVRIIGSIQNPHTTRRIVAEVLNFPLTKVRVVQAELGGAFGGKDDLMNIISARAAIAAIKTRRPVKVRYTREESVVESYKRHPYIMKYKVGFNDDGIIKAMKIDILADGGAYASMSPFVTWRTVVQATGPYEIENVHTDVRAVYTNNPYTGAMRGFGSPQPIFAQESLMDEIAEIIGVSPYEIRKINGVKPGSITASGHKLRDHDVNLLSVLERAERETNFTERHKECSRSANTKFQTSQKFRGSGFILKKDEMLDNRDIIKKGIGLAVSLRGCSLGAEGIDAAAAYLSVQKDGSAYLISGLAENGQGLRTTFSIIAAEVLGISPEHIYYLEQDTGIIADSGPTVASRSTIMGGSAVKNAAEIIKKRFEEMLLTYWNIKSKDQLLFKNNRVYEQSRSISFSELCSLAYSKGLNMSAIGWFKGPSVHWDEEKGQGAAYFTYVYGCQVAEVSANLLTGEIFVDRIVAVHDPGKIINLMGAKGQVFGGVTQGAGYALWEGITTYNGNIRENNFDQILIPTSKDIGEIESIFLEGEDIYGAWGAKSLGEPTLELTAAAIANAVKNATGLRYFNLPLNPEEILLSRKLSPNDLSRGSTN
ncbi:MAG: xanthine dehydrogenase family protein [Melioribacteraceae bacterium]|nr:xanthine dehydrogenase family protein [Melioribacteraceae bacterium]